MQVLALDFDGVVCDSLREVFGVGTLLGLEILPSAAEGGWYQPAALMLLPPSAFFIIGFLIWAIRAWKPVQVEDREFQEVKVRPEADEPVLAARVTP